MLPPGPSPRKASQRSLTAQRPALPHPGKHLRLCPFKVTLAPRQKETAQMTEHFKAPEIIQLSSEQIANLSDTQFKTLVIKKLTQLVEFGKKLEKMKAMLRETKENVQGTNSDAK